MHNQRKRTTSEPNKTSTEAILIHLRAAARQQMAAAAYTTVTPSDAGHTGAILDEVDCLSLNGLTRAHASAVEKAVDELDYYDEIFLMDSPIGATSPPRPSAQLSVTDVSGKPITSGVSYARALQRANNFVKQLEWGIFNPTAHIVLRGVVDGNLNENDLAAATSVPLADDSSDSDDALRPLSPDTSTSSEDLRLPSLDTNVSSEEENPRLRGEHDSSDEEQPPLMRGAYK